MTKNRMNYVLNPKPTQLIRLNEVSDGGRQGLGLQTNYFPLNVLHLFVIEPDEAMKLVRNCVPSNSEGHTLLWKVNAMHRTILLFKHYTQLLTISCEVQKIGLHCSVFFFLSETSNNPF
jgi:hypothetical protein